MCHKKLFISFLVLMFVSCSATKYHKESSIYEFYTGYTHAKFFLVLDIIDKTFTFSSDNYAICGYYKTSENNDTLFFSRNCIIGSLEVKAKDTCCVGTSVFIKDNNCLKDISIKYFHLGPDNQKELLPSCPPKLYKIPISVLKQEQEYLKYSPWIIR